MSERTEQIFLQWNNDWKPYEVSDSKGRTKKHYAIFIQNNTNYPKYEKDKYNIWCKKTFGNISGNCRKANSKEEILQIIREHMKNMCKPDHLIKNAPKPVRKNIIITIGELDLTLTENEIEKTLFSFGNEITVQKEHKILFFDKETGGQIVQEGSTTVIIYPVMDHTKCPIYQKQNYCCGSKCTTSCKYYSFNLKANEWLDHHIKTTKSKHTLDYFFKKAQEEAET